MFSKRTNWSLAPNKLSVCLEALKKEGHNVLNLAESNPTRCGFPYPKNEILTALHDPNNMIYEPWPSGALAAREGISRYYQKKNLEVPAEKIFLTSSTSEAYSYLFRLLLESGERILVPRPSYPLFEFLTQLNDITIDYYPLVYKKEWRIDLKALERAVSQKTRAIIIVNPNNPTGSFLKQKELLEINNLCRKHGMAIICDEVFLDYPFADNDSRPISLVDNSATLTFVLSGISKSLALPQMKIGWIVTSGPQELMKESQSRLEVIADTYLSVNTPSQNALASWLSQQRSIQREVLKRIEENRKFLTKALSKSQECHCLHGEGGWYVIMRLPSKYSEERWVMDFLKKDHVYVHPGYFFDFKEEAYIVLSLLPQPAVFREGVSRILKRVRAAVFY